MELHNIKALEGAFAPFDYAIELLDADLGDARVLLVLDGDGRIFEVIGAPSEDALLEACEDWLDAEQEMLDELEADVAD